MPFHTKENMSGVISNDSELKEYIKEQFDKIENIAQFVSLLNYIDTAIYDTTDSKKKITVKSLNYIFSTKDKRYKTFNIPKKNGKNRVITAPDDYLKYIQHLINIIFQALFYEKIHYNTNGFIINRGIVRNAVPHIGKKYLLNIDIKDFFPTIKFSRVKAVLYLNPFNLNGGKEKIAFFIANLCTYHGSLPQGAPTSPILSNIVTQKLDRRISQFCNKQHIKYSRYADDLSFSSNNDILKNKFIEEIENIIIAEGFLLNSEKTRLKNNGDRQEVTGIIVNKKLNVNRDFLRKTRAILNNWEKKGTVYTQKKFLLHYRIDKGQPDFKNVLWGYISFIGLVRGKKDNIYSGLLKKFTLLSRHIDYSIINRQDIKDRLIKDNIEMELFYFQYLLNSEDTFIQYCTSAFHQVENLLYYFYWKRFPEISDLCQFLYHNNPDLRKRYKNGFMVGKIGDIQINHLVYVFEKEFYFDLKISYNKEITFLRNARNDNSHRCLMNNLNIPEIKSNYEKMIEQNKNYYEKHRKRRPLTETEKRNELNYKFIIFMERKNYNNVREILCKIIKQIGECPDTINML